MRGFRGVLLVCLLAAVAGPARGSNPLILPPAEATAPSTRTWGLWFEDQAGRPIETSIEGSTVHVRIVGIVARATVTQFFRNPTDGWIDARYVFPLPDDAAVDALRMVVGERVIEGHIEEREAAAEAFAAAQTEGRKASLLEQRLANVFTTSVANIGPRERVEVTIELQARVRCDGGLFRFTFPTFVAARYSPSAEALGGGVTGDPTSATGFLVELDAGLPLGRLESPTHTIAVRQQLDGSHTVRLADAVTVADRDFVLEWRPDIGNEPSGAVYVEDLDGERYVLALLVPPVDELTAPRLARETILVLDTSGSMSGSSIEQGKQAVLAALDALRPTDSFNVLRFSDDVESTFPAPVPASVGNVQIAREMVEALVVSSGTNIQKALVAALAMQGTPSVLRQVIFISDGLVGGEQAALDLVTQHLGEARLFPVAIGAAPNQYLLRKAAQLGRGTLTQITASSAVAAETAKLLAKLDAPTLYDLALSWDAPDAEVFPARAPDLYLGEPIVLVARVPADTTTLEISGRGTAGRWSRTLALGGRQRESFGGIAKLWARDKVEWLLDERAVGANAADVRAEIVELGLRFGLLTEYTSLIAVDDRVTAPERQQRQEEENFTDGPVQDCITVTSESPLLDERRISVSTTVTNDELRRVPTARDPWAVLAQAPGVLTARSDVGAGRDRGDHESLWAVDGVIITDISALGVAPSYYDFDSLEEMEVTSGNTDASSATPSVTMKLMTARGTNVARGSGSLRIIDEVLVDGTESTGDRVERDVSGEAEGGGPLREDHLWLWGLLRATELSHRASGGALEEESALSGSTKLNAQLTGSTSLAVQFLAADGRVDGAGADPRRTPASLSAVQTRDQSLRFEATKIFNAAAYGQLTYIGSRTEANENPTDTARVSLDAAGRLSGGGFFREEAPRLHRLRLASQIFRNLQAVGGGTQTIDLGATAAESRRRLSWSVQEEGWWVRAGSPYGLANGLALAELWSGGELDVEHGDAAIWAQDQLQLERTTWTAGLRLDSQRTSDGTLKRQRFTALSPRLAATWALGTDRNLLLRASLGRFHSWDAVHLATRLSTGAPSATLALFEDADGDLRVDADEELSLAPWGVASGEPGSSFWRAGAIAHDLEAERQDEATLALEMEPTTGFALSLHATAQRRSRLLEERLLVRAAGGDARLATRADWQQAGTVAATPYYDLAAGLEPAGVLLANGDREVETFKLSLAWQRRFDGAWMTRGHLTWARRGLQLGPESRSVEDPTPGLYDAEQGEAADLRSENPFGVRSASGGRWSFHAGALYRFQNAIGVSASLSGRQGDPLPRFRRVLRPIAGLTEVRLSDRLDDERAQDVIQLDLRLDRDFELGGWTLTPSLEIFNLLDDRPVLRRELDAGLSRAGAIDEAAPARAVRLGFRVEWN